MSLLQLYRTPGLSVASTGVLLETVQRRVSDKIRGIDSEFCFNIATEGELAPDELRILIWLLSETFEPEQFGSETFLGSDEVLEVGPRMNFSTAWSTNAVSICHACGLTQVRRIERSRRYLLKTPAPLRASERDAFLAEVYDRMTECPYPEPLTTFETGVEPEAMFEVPVMQKGRVALEQINREMGLAFDDWDLDYYTELFLNRIQRNPTNVECFDIAQSNSEHSRHWFFKGRLIVDGQAIEKHLLGLIKEPLTINPRNM
jgi:phosphoribosylformylglycinamidine synthase